MAKQKRRPLSEPPRGHRIYSGLPAKSKCHRQKIGVTIVAQEHPVIPSLGVKLHMPLCPERDAHAAVDSRLVERVLRDHLVCRDGYRVITEVRIKSSEHSRRRLRKLLPALIQSA